MHSNEKWLIALLLTLLPWAAEAAGLGKLSILSALGQPLVAEVEISVTPEEMGSFSARVASPDAFRAANLDFNPALIGARITVERRPNGQRFLRITSTRAVDEPFIDMLVEITWAAGRISREYTALLDPPGLAPAPVVATLPEPAAAPAPRVEPEHPAPMAIRRLEPAAPAPRPAITAPAPAATAPGEYGPVQRGETLSEIALELLPEGVRLEQMLVALFRSNPDAFIRNNMNLMRTDKVLRIPAKAEIASIARHEAVAEYRTHVADWNSYRQRLAGATSDVSSDGRATVSGKIATRVEEGSEDGVPKDVLRVSKGEVRAADGKRSAAGDIRALEEEVVAREKAVGEARERIAELERTLEDLKKLAALRNGGAPEQQAARQVAALQGGSEAAAPVAIPASSPVKPEPGSRPAIHAAKAKASKSKAREPELMEQIVEAVADPLYLGVGGGVLLAGGLAFWLARRRNRNVLAV